MVRKILIGVMFVFACSLTRAYAQELTIVYTGETRSALYPCHCPVKPDGGIARRATKIKELRAANPDLILIDAGNVFGGGAHDAYVQNVDLDKKRTSVNLAGLSVMKYDAIGVGFDEFNFGKDFISQEMQNKGLVFVSSNINLAGVVPYVIKKVGDTDVAVICLTPSQVKDKVPDIEVVDPHQALKKTLAEVKKKGADVVILLSNFLLGEEEELVKEFPAVNVLIAPASGGKDEKPKDAINETIVLRPSREGRLLKVAKLTILNKKITGRAEEDIRLSSDIVDDPAITAILPKCFSAFDCRAESGFVAQCVNAGEIAAACEVKEKPKVALTVLKPKQCITCDVDGQLAVLKKAFGNVVVTSVDFESPQGKKLAADIGVELLPAYIFGKDIEQDKNFPYIKDKLEVRKDYYYVKPDFIGLSYFGNRKRIPGKLDVFISLFEANSAELLSLIEPYKPSVHLLSVEDPQSGAMSCPNGAPELEEDLRTVCVMKYYPAKAFDYMRCRATNIASSWWEDCAQGLDTNKIKYCAKTKVGVDLLRENTQLNKELKIGVGPTYVLSNQEIFSSKQNPKKEEFKKIMEANK